MLSHSHRAQQPEHSDGRDAAEPYWPEGERLAQRAEERSECEGAEGRSARRGWLCAGHFVRRRCHAKQLAVARAPGRAGAPVRHRCPSGSRAHGTRSAPSVMLEPVHARVPRLAHFATRIGRLVRAVAPSEALVMPPDIVVAGCGPPVLASCARAGARQPRPQPPALRRQLTCGLRARGGPAWQRLPS